jgi:NADH:ubiquinone oxidoreductase subunit D
VKNFLTFFRPKIDEYEELLTTNRIWVERTKECGQPSPPRIALRWA